MDFTCHKCGGHNFTEHRMGAAGQVVRTCDGTDWVRCNFKWVVDPLFSGFEVEESTPTKAAIDYHSKPSPMIRSVMDAMDAAEHKRTDLPHVVQVNPRDWDLVILADYIRELETKSNPNIAALKNAVNTLDVQATQIAEEVRELVDERTNYQELIGNGEPVAIVTEFGGIEYYEPLQEGTFLYIHHYTTQDMAKADQYAADLYKLLKVE